MGPYQDSFILETIRIVYNIQLTQKRCLGEFELLLCFKMTLFGYIIYRK